MQVFDENGSLIFNSNKYYFDVKGQYNVQQEDLWRSSFNDNTTRFPRKITIGEFSRSNSAVVINSGSYGFCDFFRAMTFPHDIVYTLVFSSTIYLEPRIAPWVNEWSTFTNAANHIAYPNFSRVSSGVFLDTTNIS